jgi:Ca2+-binding RTX toxin-like protein
MLIGVVHWERDLEYNSLTSFKVQEVIMAKQLIFGTNSSDVINILDGFHVVSDDYIIAGLKGNDLMIGGLGNDILSGGAGNDTLMGVAGSNVLSGDAGNDTMFGIVDVAGSVATPVPLTGLHIDSPNNLFGGIGDDTLVGSIGVLTGTFLSNDTSSVSFLGGNSLFGGDGADHLYGTYQILHLVANGITGAASNNTVNSNLLDGGSGNDFLVGNVDFILHDFIATNITLIASFNSNTLLGGSGDDEMMGNLNSCIQNYTNTSGFVSLHYSDDLLDGGSDNDLIIGDCHDVTINVVTSPGFSQDEICGSDTIIGGTGNDRLIGDNFQLTSLSSQVKCFFGNDILYGGQGNDIITGEVVNNFAANIVLGHNQFVYDGGINNGDDKITDFHVALDTLVGQHGATFSDGGIVSGSRVVLVDDAGSSSTITLVGVTDPYTSIMQTHGVIV